MGKELSEMTLEELWDLFPIFLVQHDDKWNGHYKEMLLRLLQTQKCFPTKGQRRLSRSSGRNITKPEMESMLWEFTGLIPIPPWGSATLDETVHIWHLYEKRLK